MNIKDLFAATPVARHPHIRVAGNLVFVRETDGDIVEYLLDSDGNLWAKPSMESVALNFAALTTALANARTAINAIRTDVAAIKTKVGA